MWIYFDLLAPLCCVCGLSSPGRLCPGCRADLPRLPPLCARCGDALPGNGPCPGCRRESLPIGRTLAALPYAFPVDRLVQQLKFDGRLPRAAVLGGLLADAAGAAGADRGPDCPAALVPVPLHPRRLRERGYNQAERIAAVTGRRLGLPVLADAVVRHRHTPAQSGLDLAQRQRNLHDAFSVAGALPAHVALIDDVMTTGSTLQALAGVLRAAGVAHVDAWVVARAV